MSRAGLKQIGLCDAGTLNGTPENAIAMGVRGGASLDIVPHGEIKDYRNRSLRNMIKFTAKAETYQSTMKMLKALKDFTNLQADVQLQTSPQDCSTQNSEDVFQFVGDNVLGLGFEYKITADKRSCNVTLEAAMEYDRAKTLIDSADSTTLKTLPGIAGEGVDFTQYRAPYFLAFENPSGTALFSSADIISRTIKISTKGKKDAYERDIVDYLSVSIEVELRDASIAKHITDMNKAMGTTLKIKEKNSGNNYDGFEFAANVLTQREEFSISDDERKRKVIFEADIPICDVTFDLGASAGGVTDGDGTVGGTMKFGF